MQTRMGLLAVLLTAVGTLVPAVGYAQEYTQPDPNLPLPLFHDRPESGGFYTAGEFVYYQMSNPLTQQLVAIRGIFDLDGSIASALGLPATPGTFIGSGAEALNVNQVSSSEWTPGYRLTIGWKFEQGFTMEFSYLHLATITQEAMASLLPRGLVGVGPNLQNTFLSSFVYNFPTEFGGDANKLSVGNPGAAFGIWNAASVMQEFFTQRFSQYDFGGRIPMFQTDDGDACDGRCYGLLGARVVDLKERYNWRTISENIGGMSATGASDVAVYTDMVSNIMYGFDLGCGWEQYICSTPIGSFSWSFEGRVAPLIDIVKSYSKYELGDRDMAAKQAHRDYTFAAEAEATLNFWWYPIEGVEVRLGWDAMAFFNTIASPQPIDFNFGSLDPQQDHEVMRLLHGFHAGIGFIF